MKSASGKILFSFHKEIFKKQHNWNDTTNEITFFQNNVLPSGEKTKKGLSMVIRDVTRHHAGTYTCTANNDVGQPHTAEIDLRVLCK